MSISATVLSDIIAGTTLAGLSVMATFVFKRVPKEMGQFSRDWYGTPERPGFPAVPGVPERLQNTENTLGELREYVVAIDHELHPNSGKSLRDDMNRMSKAVADVQEDVASLHTKLEASN